MDYLHEEKVDTPEGIPNPIIKIDNQSDRYHTVVSIQFGDRLGELLDTVGRRHASLLNAHSAYWAR